MCGQIATQMRTTHTHTHTHTHIFFTFLDTLPAPSKTDRMPCWKRCRAACCAESGGKNANAKGVRIIGSPSILRWSGRASHLETTKNHQTQCQCRISWDRKQSLLVDPIRAPTRDNASRLGGLAPRELRTLNPDAPGAASRSQDDCQTAQAPLPQLGLSRQGSIICWEGGRTV